MVQPACPGAKPRVAYVTNSVSLSCRRYPLPAATGQAAVQLPQIVGTRKDREDVQLSLHRDAGLSFVGAHLDSSPRGRPDPSYSRCAAARVNCVHSANHQAPATTHDHSRPAGTALGHGARSTHRSTAVSTTQPVSRTATTRTRRCLNMSPQYPIVVAIKQTRMRDSTGGMRGTAAGRRGEWLSLENSCRRPCGAGT
jgi:hypothetical protein